MSQQSVRLAKGSYMRLASRQKGYLLPEAMLSLKDFKIQRESKNIIDDEDIIKLANMACIDLKAASKKVSIDAIKSDVNFILNCAKILQTDGEMNASSISFDSTLSLIAVDNLRVDKPEAPSSKTKSTMLSNSPAKYRGFFVVPKLRK